MHRIFPLILTAALTSACDDVESPISGDLATDLQTPSDAGASDQTITADQMAGMKRSLRGTISDPMVNKVVAISETGVEIVSALSKGAFVFSELACDKRYLLDFRNGTQSEGWLTFSIGTSHAWVIPRGVRDIDLGECKSDENLSFTSAHSPLDATDDDGDGVVDAKDDYKPLPPDTSLVGFYAGRQVWNDLTYGIAFVPVETDQYRWKIYISELTKPACQGPLEGFMEKFGEGFVALFQDQYKIAANCSVHDHLQFRMSKSARGKYQGINTHYLIGLDKTCTPVGCMDTPPHGGVYTLDRHSDTSCK